MEPSSALQGNLRDTNLADVLKELERRQASGVLFLERGKDEKRFVFDAGRLVFARTNDPDERLGACLLRDGVITVTQLDLSVRLMIETGRKLGAVLCEMHYLSPDDLFVGLQKQLRTIILAAFGWSWGGFRVEPGDPETEADAEFPFSLNQLILDGTLGTRQWSRIEKGLAVDLDRAFDRTPQADSILFGVEVPDEVTQVFSLANGRNTVARICSMSFLNEFETLRVLWALTTVGAIQPAAGPASDPAQVPPVHQEIESLLEQYQEFFTLAYDFIFERIGELVDHLTDQALAGLPEDLRGMMGDLNLHNGGRIEFEEMMKVLAQVPDSGKLSAMVRTLNEILRSVLRMATAELGRDDASTLLQSLAGLAGRRPGVPIGALSLP